MALTTGMAAEGESWTKSTGRKDCACNLSINMPSTLMPNNPTRPDAICGYKSLKEREMGCED